LDYDSVYYQSRRGDIYKDYLDKLLKKGHAVLRDGAYFLNFSFSDTVWIDQIKGDIKVTDADRDFISNLVLFKSDGTPTYHFASVVDDIDLDINCVIRGVDHIPNTAKHVAIYRALGVDLPLFYHVGLLMGADGKKLSKRTGAVSVVDYQDDNSPAALKNYLLRMGWSPSLDNKANSALDNDRAIDMFWKDGKMRSSPAKLDDNKLKWYNKKHK